VKVIRWLGLFFAFVTAALAVAFQLGHLSIKVDLPPAHAAPAPMSDQIEGWSIVAAVFGVIAIMAVAFVDLVVRLVRRLARR
jgi:hypothetical protein